MCSSDLRSKVKTHQTYQMKRRMVKIQETLNKGLEELKSKQTIMNNTINEIKNSLEGINSRITKAEEG